MANMMNTECCSNEVFASHHGFSQRFRLQPQDIITRIELDNDGSNRFYLDRLKSSTKDKHNIIRRHPITLQGHFAGPLCRRNVPVGLAWRQVGYIVPWLSI